jgi:hypothetical protein
MCATITHEDITTQTLKSLEKKDAQVQERGRELADKFHSVVEDFGGARTS